MVEMTLNQSTGDLLLTSSMDFPPPRGPFASKVSFLFSAKCECWEDLITSPPSPPCLVPTYTLWVNVALALLLCHSSVCLLTPSLFLITYTTCQCLEGRCYIAFEISSAGHSLRELSLSIAGTWQTLFPFLTNPRNQHLLLLSICVALWLDLTSLTGLCYRPIMRRGRLWEESCHYFQGKAIFSHLTDRSVLR